VFGDETKPCILHNMHQRDVTVNGHE